MSYTFDYLKPFLDSVVDLNPDTVLDVGCGNGAAIEYLAEAGIEAIGIDPAAPQYSSVVLEGTADNIPFGNDSFDCVISTFALHHYPDASLFLNEAARVATRRIMILDVWYDSSIGSQVNSQRLSRLCKTIEQRHGIVHNFDYSTRRLYELATSHKTTQRLTISTMLRFLDLDRLEMTADVDSILGEFDITNSERAELAQIWSEISVKGGTQPGAVTAAIVL